MTIYKIKADGKSYLDVGTYDNLPFLQYQADPAERPSLNASIGKILLDKPPLYAWLAHPKLNPKWRPEDDGDTEEQKKRKRIGSAVHKMLLGKGQDIVALAFPDYRTKDAREARDANITAGHIPLLTKEYDRAAEVIASLLSKGPLYDQAKMIPERVFIWKDIATGVLCRAMMDLTSEDVIIDLKTVESLSDSYLINQIESYKYAFQACFYLKAFNLSKTKFKWIFIEINPPYEHRVIELDRSRQDIGMRQVDFAINRWRACLDMYTWPGYNRLTERLTYPQWAEAKWLEKEIAESDH